MFAATNLKSVGRSRRRLRRPFQSRDSSSEEPQRPQVFALESLRLGLDRQQKGTFSVLSVLIDMMMRTDEGDAIARRASEVLEAK